jgi:protein tyrosine phosphatase (PTP) superfamily phosphohydrolase (DUF442 family)
MNIETSYNFRRISERVTTSGVVRPDVLKALAAQGYEVVVNLLPDTSEYAIPNERDAVESQRLEYFYIPVDFKQPTWSDFLKFSETLDGVHEKKILVHCAANYRVSAFYSFYAVRRGYWSADRAMEFIRSIWQPAEHPGWSEFITGILTEVSAQQGIAASSHANAPLTER